MFPIYEFNDLGLDNNTGNAGKTKFIFLSNSTLQDTNIASVYAASNFEQYL